MRKETRRARLWGVLIVLTVISTVQILTAEAQDGSLYRDKNGYFAAVPPKGWKQQDYPSDTIRSKVAFHHPSQRGAVIRVISGRTRETLTSLYELNGGDNRLFFLRKYPGSSFDVRKERRLDREALIIHMSVPGATEQEIVQFIRKGLWYSIAFAGRTKNQFESNYHFMRSFMNRFVMLHKDRKFSQEEIRAGQGARVKRLAELAEKDRNWREGLRWVQFGLERDPKNKDLKELQTRLQSNAGRR